MIKKILLIFVFGLCAQVAKAQQAESVVESNGLRVRVEEVKLFKGQGIPFLSWSKRSYPVDNGAFTKYANIGGKFKEKVKSATMNGSILPVGEDGTFDILLGYTGDEKSFIITVIGENNKIYRMQYKITPTTGRGFEGPGSIPSRWRFSAGAGITIISYRQQDTNSFDQKVITVKAGTVYTASKKIDLGLNAFFNLVPLSTTSVDGNKIQYLGVNVRAGYHLIDAPSRVRMNINLGLYFNNSYGTVGFANMYGPQISPDLVYIFKNGNTLFWYAKYAYSLYGTKGISFKDNREIASGMHYSFPITDANRLSVGVDLSQLSLSLADAWASTNTYSLSAGISF